MALSDGEIVASVSRKVGKASISGSGYFSPDHFLGGSSAYLSVTGAAPIGSVVGLPLRTDVTLGRSMFSRSIGDFTDVKFRILTQWEGFGLAASLTVAEPPRSSPLPGRERAGSRLAFTVLRMF